MSDMQGGVDLAVTDRAAVSEMHTSVKTLGLKCPAIWGESALLFALNQQGGFVPSHYRNAIKMLSLYVSNLT